jgi:hypothetical protein
VAATLEIASATIHATMLCGVFITTMCLRESRILLPPRRIGARGASGEDATLARDTSF